MTISNRSLILALAVGALTGAAPAFAQNTSSLSHEVVLDGELVDGHHSLKMWPDRVVARRDAATRRPETLA